MTFETRRDAEIALEEILTEGEFVFLNSLGRLRTPESMRFALDIYREGHKAGYDAGYVEARFLFEENPA